MTVPDDFTSRTAPLRGELLAHCYRMLGSRDEAEDLVQETYLRAWRSYAGFEGRASLRTWMYRIATNVCLTEIERRGRRPVPDDVEAAGVGAGAPAVPWLQPFPDGTAEGEHEDPAAVAAARTGIRLALVAALQYLPARQRAMLILRDVLEFPAVEVAGLLDTTTSAVNSGVRRARAQLTEAMPAEDTLAEPAEPDRQAQLERLASAFENADVGALTALLRQDVTLEMPPLPHRFAGRKAVVRFLAANALTAPGRFHLVPVRANGQAAFGVYQREPDGVHRFYGVQVPTISATGIARIVTFRSPDLCGPFGLPREKGASTPGATNSSDPAGL